MTNSKPKMNVILVGRQGNGKTSCGKSIENAIPSKDLPNIKAIICSGVGDTGEDLQDSIENISKRVEHEVKRCDINGGISSIVFVLKYGVRFTKQEKDAVEVVDLLFGADALKRWGIIIFSYGDLFYMDNEEDGRLFLDWCKEQSGDIKQLFERVSYRCVLFDNKTREEGKQNDQLEKLKVFVNEIAIINNMETYIMKDFESAAPTQQILISRESKKPVDSTNNTDEKKRNAEYNKRSPCAQFKSLTRYVWSFVIGHKYCVCFSIFAICLCWRKSRTFITRQLWPRIKLVIGTHLLRIEQLG